MAKIPAPPPGTSPAGRRLWRTILVSFMLAEHELVLLRQACAVADVCDELRASVVAEGAVVVSRLGEKRANPAVVELRQQQLTLARLVVALRVPLGDQEGLPAVASGRTPRRGLRGVYGTGVVS